MGRNLKYQYLNAIDKNFKEGMDKKSMKKQGHMNTTRIFSYADRKNLVDTASNFSNWMKNNHPEIKQVKDVNGTHIQGFLNHKSESCSKATLEQYGSKFNKLENIVNNTYNTSANYKGHTTPTVANATKIRNSSMSKEDFKKLENSLSNSNSSVKNAIQLTGKGGLRVSECAKFKGKDINLEKGTLFVKDGKGGRDREIPIRDCDKQYFQELKERYGDEERICPVQKGSINQALRREMEKLGISEKYPDSGIHCIRKMYAQEQYDTYREQGMEIKQALGKVSVDLGHSENRLKLMEQYVLNIH